jgi:hypothetical protein
MDDSIRKLMEQVNQQRRLKEQLFGPLELLATEIQKSKLVSEHVLGVTSIAATMDRAGLAHGLHAVDRELEIVRERLRELSAFSALGGSEIGKSMEAFNTRPVLSEAIMKALEQASTSLHERFRFPGFTELRNLQERMSAAHAPFWTMQPNVGEFQREFNEIQRTLDAISTPWVDTLNASRSFDSFAGLAALGSAVRVAPYEPATIETVRQSLGAWAPLPKDVRENSLKRDDFYQEHGLDSKLIALPEPAFTQTLELTGVVAVELLFPNADDVKFDIEQQLTPEEHALLGRMSKASQLVNVLEIKLRGFIHDVMTRRYGVNWEKSRAPDNGKICAKWEEKRQKALKNGESALELIYYADFTDYAKLIIRRDNWKELFSAVFPDEDDLRVSFKRLEPLRVPPMHSRPVTKGDLLTIGTEVTRILTAIGMLKKT